MSEPACNAQVGLKPLVRVGPTRRVFWEDQIRGTRARKKCESRRVYSVGVFAREHGRSASPLFIFASTGSSEYSNEEKAMRVLDHLNLNKRIMRGNHHQKNSIEHTCRPNNSKEGKQNENEKLLDYEEDTFFPANGDPVPFVTECSAIPA